MHQLNFMGILYAILGILHFTNTGFYRPFMPKFLPAHDLLIYLSDSDSFCFFSLWQHINTFHGWLNTKIFYPALLQTIRIDYKKLFFY